MTNPATSYDRTDQQPTATLVRGRLPTEEFALGETLSAVPDLRVTCASLGAAGQAAIMPLVWFQTTDDTVEPALERDPTVVSATELVRTDERRLYRMEWSSDICSLCRMLLTSQAILRTASATESHWSVEILYPSHETIRQTSEYCEQHNLSFEIESVHTLDSEQTTLHGLTSAQYEALTLACQRGYFTVPREIDLQELSDEIGVTHQALSERLRRGHETLITAVLGEQGSTQPVSSLDERSIA